MEEREMVLAIEICELPGKSVSAKEVEKAHEKAKKKLERLDRPPKEAIVTYVRT